MFIYFVGFNAGELDPAFIPKYTGNLTIRSKDKITTMEQIKKLEQELATRFVSAKVFVLGLYLLKEEIDELDNIDSTENDFVLIN